MEIESIHLEHARGSISMNETFERVRALMVREFQIEPKAITPQTQLTDLGVDSLGALEFVFALEDTFSITVDSNTDLRGGTVQDVVDVVERALSREPAATVAT
jgi:acyl carrier protein